ncbi:hypothetical protein DUNSADRAFT_4851, partial [Dunaliella salina]
MHSTHRVPVQAQLHHCNLGSWPHYVRRRDYHGSSRGLQARTTVTGPYACSDYSPKSISLTNSQLRLIRPCSNPAPVDKLLVYLPGTDGTGQSIQPQIAALRATGFDVYSLVIPPSDRSGWYEATQQ